MDNSHHVLANTWYGCGFPIYLLHQRFDPVTALCRISVYRRPAWSYQTSAGEVQKAAEERQVREGETETMTEEEPDTFTLYDTVQRQVTSEQNGGAAD